MSTGYNDPVGYDANLNYDGGPPLHPPPITPPGGTIPSPTWAEYKVLVVNMHGVPYGELSNANITSVTWELNSWGECVFVVPVLDPQVGLIQLLTREVQIWRNGRLIWWGIMVAATADETKVTVTCNGLLWYFSRRYFGPAYSSNSRGIVTNGDFELGITGWTHIGTAGSLAWDIFHIRYVGHGSMKITTSGTTVDYAVQSIFPNIGRNKPLVVTASAWVYVNRMAGSNPEREIGLYLKDNSPGTGPFGENEGYAPISNGFPLQTWVRLEVSIVSPGVATVPPPALGSQPYEIRLYGVLAGEVYWDNVRLTYEQKTGISAGQDWSDDFLRRVFNYGAGNSGGGSTGPGGSFAGQYDFWGAPSTEFKTSLNMNFVGSTIAAGSSTTEKTYNHEDESEIFAAMAEIPARDLCDFEIVWNASGTTRSFVTYPPRKGSYKPALALEAGRNMTAFSYQLDGRNAANDVKIMGRSSTGNQEVGQAGGPTTASISPTRLGGVQYESVQQATVELDTQGLIDKANSEYERLSQGPLVVPTVSVHEQVTDDILGTTQPGGPLTVGDTVSVRIHWGWIQEEEVRRVVKMTLKPGAGGDVLDIVFNS